MRGRQAEKGQYLTNNYGEVGPKKAKKSEWMDETWIL